MEDPPSPVASGLCRARCRYVNRLFKCVKLFSPGCGLCRALCRYEEKTEGVFEHHVYSMFTICLLYVALVCVVACVAACVVEHDSTT